MKYNHLLTWRRARREPGSRPRNIEISPLTLSAILDFFGPAWGGRREEGVGWATVTVSAFSGSSSSRQYWGSRFRHEQHPPLTSRRSLAVSMTLPPGYMGRLRLLCARAGVSGAIGLPQFRASSLNRSRMVATGGRFEGWEPCSTDQAPTNNSHN